MAADDGNTEKKKKMMVGWSFGLEVSNILITWLVSLR